jgi:hypothetical protein
LEQEGNDKLIITSTAGPRSTTTRIEVQEGLVRVIGDAVKMFQDQLQQAAAAELAPIRLHDCGVALP